MQTMKAKIKEIMSVVFEVDVASIGNNASPDNIENWDSLNHINLITSLEDEFNMRFDDENISEMLNLDLILYIINQKTNK